jgi:hypothetical protein
LVWKKLWRCKIPPKVRVFIEPMDICATCGAHPESTYHAFFTCSYARQFWRTLTELTSVKLPELHPVTWSVDILDEKCCNEHDRCLILCGMWSLWSSRNDRKHGRSPIPVKLAIDWALDVCFHLILDTNRKIQTQPASTEVRWQKPEAGVVKININGSFQEETFVGATGAVIQDDNSAFLKAMA